MKPSDEDARAALRLINEGKFAEAVRRLDEAADHAWRNGQAGEATAALIAAARILSLQGDIPGAQQRSKAAEEPAAAAGKTSELLQLQAEFADREAVPSASRAAWDRVAATGDAAARATALLHLADLSIAAGQPLEAAAHYGDAIADAERAEDRKQVAALLIERAICRSAGSEILAAQNDLSRAESLLEVNDGGLRARVLGQRGLIAAESGEIERGLDLTIEARDAAVSANDVLAYLQAVTQMARLQQRLGREVDVYDTLVRARISLKDLLGEDGEAMVRPLIQVYEQQLGSRLEKIRAAWIARRRTAQSRDSR